MCPLHRELLSEAKLGVALVIARPVHTLVVAISQINGVIANQSADWCGNLPVIIKEYFHISHSNWG